MIQMRSNLKIFFESFTVILTLLNSQPCAAFCSVPFRTTACSQKLHESATNSISTPENQQSAGAAPFPPGSHQELMYTLGVNLARQLGDISPLVENGDELSNVAKGVLDVIVGRLDEAQQAKLLIANKERLNALLTERSNDLKKVLVETGQAMLNQMKEVEGTSVLDSGVVLHLLEPGPEGPGRGVRPTTASTVKVHYQGTLPDGTVFDSSMGGEPVNIALGQVIPGWKEALLKMHEGETAMIGIPPSAAYGDNGSPDGRIPGGATVFFKIQLIKVLSAGVGGSAKLFGADGKELSSPKQSSTGSAKSGLLGANGLPL